ncbi:MAG: glutamate racemase [Bacteroidales bacterium]|nr:glutamate racemase [Bacteroidales bacterium]
MQLKADQPIGIFDSGVGGLTVAHAIKSLLPQEKIIYFGDTFHLPYGDKSSESVRYYASRISDFLLEKHCKTVMIACNTASSSAFDEVVEHVADRAIVMNVVDPIVSLVSEKHADGRVGVIGTKGTINSGTYEHKIRQKNTSLEVISMATPLFVPMIEEGFIFDDISNAIIRAYLTDKRFSGIHTMILGCTHYPIIKRQIEKLFNFGVDIVDSGNIVANKLKRTLEEKGLMHTGKPAKHEFYISDYTPYFEKIAKMFFEEEVHLEHLNFWK